MSLSICVAQLNYVVGDIEGNADRIIAAARQAYRRGCRLFVTPELAICGYPAEDLLLRPAFIKACDDAVCAIAEALAPCNDLTVVLGHPTGGDRRTRSTAVQERHNAATVCRGGRVLGRYAKQELPNYQVFDERRYFVPGQDHCVFEVQGLRVGLLICEDAWFEAPARQARAAGAQLLLVLNASPYHRGKGDEREAMMADRARSTGLPLVYAHLVGGQDEVVFEGRSFVLDGAGCLRGRAPSFDESLFEIHVNAAPDATNIEATRSTPPDEDEELWRALVLGVRDYVDKNGFPGAVVGLSGGIDSALVLALAVDALGADRVRAVMMPSPYTAEMSRSDAREMARRLGVRYDELPIHDLFASFRHALAHQFQGRPEDTTEENLQARIRGTLLMALSNKFGDIVLTTGNKSETATGYCTLYGDLAGGFAVIKDVFKTAVFRLAQWRNGHDPFGRGADPIPQRILTRPPSAELRPDQRDEDSLPPYAVLDAILARYMEEDESVDQIVAAGFDRDTVLRVARLVRGSEYKRRQSPPGIRVTHRGFGKDWRYPITSKFRA